MEQLIIPKYCDSNSILLVNRTGNLKRLHCPFRVRCKIPVGLFKQDMYLWVEEVAANGNDELFFIIFGIPYLHRHFILLAYF